MFDIAPSELMIVVLAAIVLIGPKDLPRVMRVVGHWVGKGRAMMRHMRGAVDEMMREADLQELERKRNAESARVSSEHPDAGIAPAPPPLAAPARAEEPALAMPGGIVP